MTKILLRWHVIERFKLLRSDSDIRKSFITKAPHTHPENLKCINTKMLYVEMGIIWVDLNMSVNPSWSKKIGSNDLMTVDNL